MIDLSLLLLFAIVALIGIIVLLFFDRISLVEQFTKKENKLLEELSRMTKAVIAKNANDYVMTTSIDKVPTGDEEEKEEEDEVPLESLSDDDFDKAIGVQRKTPKK